MRTAVAIVIALAASPLAAACLAEDKGEEEALPEALPEDGKDDSFRKPTEKGPLAWGEPGFSELTATERYHAWTFELSGDARVDLTTSYAVRGQRRVDTVLYLYKEGPTGWGSYSARNDDYGDTLYSKLVRDLGPGRYRALVKGYAATTMGRFRLTGTCEGAGCAPPAPPAGACLFGDVYGDLFDHGLLQILNQNEITIDRLSWLGPDDQARLVVAVQQSAHTDVTTPAEALGRVDQGVVNVTWLAEPAARRSFVAFEYGAGDNSYGAIFDKVSGALVARIQDGDLVDCAVEAETCLLPEDYAALRADPRFALIEDRVITSAAGLDEIVVDQIVDAFRRRYGAEVATVADAVALADGGEINLRTYVFTDTGADLQVVEWGAGDTSVGMIYFYDSLQIAGAISDLFIEGCGVFAVTRQVGEGELCQGEGGCDGALRCEGVFAGAGVCVATTELPTAGDECDADADCGAGGVCAGATRGYGLCNPAWQRGTFVDDATVAIPDAGTLVRRLPVRGLATVDTDVVLSLRIEHPRASQLVVTLSNPTGTTATVYTGVPADDGAPLVIDRPITTGFSGDESVNGEWRLRVTDRTGGDVGALVGWTLTVTSRWD